MCRWFCWLRNQDSVAPVHMLADFLTIYGFFSPILVVVIATSPTSFSVKGTVLVGHQPEFDWTAAGPDPPAPQSNPTRKPSPKNPRKTKNSELKNDGKKKWEISNLNAMSFCPTKSLSFRCSSSKHTCFFFPERTKQDLPHRYDTQTKSTPVKPMLQLPCISDWKTRIQCRSMACVLVFNAWVVWSDQQTIF